METVIFVIASIAVIYIVCRLIFLPLKVKKADLLGFISEDKRIDDVISDIRSSLGCDTVRVAMFHNGGYFSNGGAMSKFSITHEVCAPEIALGKFRRQNILLSLYPSQIKEVITTGLYRMEDVSKEPDRIAREPMEQEGTKSLYMFLMKSSDKQPMGFVSIKYIQDIHRMTPKEISMVKSKLSTLSSTFVFN